MLTFFTCPKPFAGRMALLQKNALRSWRKLGADVEILLFGDEPGAEDMSQEVQAVHIPELARTEWGAPRVDYIFLTADERARHDLRCYINADIILLPGFLESVHAAAGLQRPFLVVGRRWDVSIEDEIDFRRPGWDDDLRRRARESGRMHSVAAIDYFLYRKGLYGGIPPFGLGRTVWDNWLVMEARRRGALVVDATDGVFCIHQDHDYSHHPQGTPGVWYGPEAARNEELAGRPEYNFTIEDATHVLTRNGVRFDFRPVKFKRHFSTLMVLHPFAAPVIKAVRRVYKFFQGSAGPKRDAPES